ncbi:HIT-like domain-containing protein [Infundibulicybe gibba]|nr:HIT-like domain-containing protein [Infundibulicybe gibba]
MGSLLFSTIEVTRQAFYRSSLSYAIVNLKPIVPGHVLVVPVRPVARLSELMVQTELSSLMHSVQRVGKIVERAYGADGLTVACQDGKAAGQSVPHVHFHLLPRRFTGDRFQNDNDAVYPTLELAESSLSSDLHTRERQQQQHIPLRVDDDAARLPRTMEEMEKEAGWLRGFFEADNS